MKKRTHITLIGLNFYPESTAIGLYSTQLAQYLEIHDIQLDVITAFPYYPQWKIASEYQNKSIVLTDDVLNSGTTLIYGIKHFLDVPLKQFKTAVLVNRNHKKYPVKADFKGISLSTSLHEHVEVVLEGENYEVFLK